MSRIKQGDKIRARQAKRWYLGVSDDVAMFAAEVDITQWGSLPEYQKQLYRLRAQQAMNILTEQSDGQP